MHNRTRPIVNLALVVTLALGIGATRADDLNYESHQALQELVAHNPAAAKLRSHALAILVFPNVKKAGFMIGAQAGKGVLFAHGHPAGRFRTMSASYGLQAGVQRFGYALFFMDHASLDWINKTRGWEIGTGPSVVIMDKGKAKSVSTNTLHSGIYAFIFDQKGLMAGLGLQGSKITRIDD